MQPYASWWSVDPDGAAAISPETKQQICYVGKAADDTELRLVSSQHRFWMRFDYEDADCKYPLLIEWQNERRGGSQRWRVDHIRSAALWRRETASATANPAYGLWRRADDAITQALTRWPATDAIGPAPSSICINGGWHNGAWTDQYYRSLSTRSRAKLQPDKYLGPPLVSLGEPAPSPWQFVSQSSTPRNVVSGWLGGFGKRKSTAESLELLLARSDFSGLPEPAFCGTHLRSQDGTRAIIPVGFLSRRDDEKHRTVRLRLLYIDDDLICDCLAVECMRPRDSAHGSVLWRILFNDNVSHLRNGGVLHRRTGLSAQLSPAASGSDGLGAAIPSPALWYRLTCALVDALPSWQAATLNLPQEYLKETSPIDVPICERVHLLGASGVPGAFLEGFAVTSLKDQVETPGVVSTFESAFKDIQETAPAQAMRTDVGWWSIEPEAKRIGNVASGQQIALDASRIENWGEENWHFHYRDREIEYPVLVRRRFEKGQFGGTAAVLEIDHAGSAKLWSARANRTEDTPSYGLWRRIDDAVVDALCCWKELGGLTQNIQVHAIGGWFNGAWHATWRRMFNGARYDPTGPTWPLAQPILEPLNSTTPPPWQFVNHARDVIRADLAHVRREPGYMPMLPLRVPLEGFQGETPYLIRADKKAVLFPAFADRRWINSSYPDFEDYYVGVGHFIYANDDMFMTCPFDAERSSFWTNWRVELGVRAEKGTELSRSEDKAKWPLAGPAGFAAWRRLAFDLLQSWPNWRGSGYRLLEDPAAFEAFKHSGDPNSGRLPKWEKSGIALEMPKKVAVTGGFVGGLYTPFFAISADMPART